MFLTSFGTIALSNRIGVVHKWNNDIYIIIKHFHLLYSITFYLLEDKNGKYIGTASRSCTHVRRLRRSLHHLLCYSGKIGTLSGTRTPNAHKAQLFSRQPDYQLSHLSIFGGKHCCRHR